VTGTLCLLWSGCILAQSGAGPASTPAAATFEAADVHVSPFERYPIVEGGNLSGDRFLLYQTTMSQIIADAYDVDPANVQGGPSWLDWDRFDIVGKAPPTTSRPEIRQMLQSLLAHRFGLVVHTASVPTTVYVLAAPQGKGKLKEAQAMGDPRCEAQPAPAVPDAVPRIRITCHNETMAELAQNLHEWGTGYLGYITKPVVDSTGLKGEYDFDLEWTPPLQLERAGPDGVTLIDAVNKQLQLKLSLESIQQPALVVDRVNETPTPNAPDLAKVMPPLPPPQFEVAVIKPYKEGEKRQGGFGGDRVNIGGATLKALILDAWYLDPFDEEALVGAPKWLDQDRFDISAELAAGDTEGPASGRPQLLEHQWQQLLRGLIEDRFQMKDHWENRTITGYRLVAVNPRLTKGDPKGRTRCDEGPGPDGKDPRRTDPSRNRLVTCQNMTMAELGVQLQSFAGGYIYRTVADDTGLKGPYNFTLSFSGVDHFLPGAQPSGNSSSQPSEPNGAITVFDALREQLGLKLEKEKRPGRVLVIDQISEQPTAN
jgi:uncharacterized protein (TIGR03435 family)